MRINGYNGGDGKMCAHYTFKEMELKSIHKYTASNATSYGTQYELISIIWALNL
jgi:hypothetical protein